MFTVILFVLSIVCVHVTVAMQVNQCVLRCKDNHMREMDNEWSTDFTLPLLSLLLSTGNETAAFVKLQEICTSLRPLLLSENEYPLAPLVCEIMRSNKELETCLAKCNKSQEAAIIIAGTKAWEDACTHLDEVRTQFTCWRNHGNELNSACRVQTIHLRDAMLQFARNQTEYYIQMICTDFDKFSNCFTQEHGRLCGLRSEIIAGRMFHSNRETMFTMLKMKWTDLPTQCGYSQLRRDTYSNERYSRLKAKSTSYMQTWWLTSCILAVTTTYS